MSIEAAFALTPTISFISYGKTMFDLHVFYLRAHLQEHNYHVNLEVAVCQNDWLGNLQAALVPMVNMVT
jgi:hypothetical protein